MRKLICASVVLAFAAIAQAEELKLNIDGMTCEVGCVKKVRDTLTKVKGVTDKKVELGKADRELRREEDQQKNDRSRDRKGRF